MSCLFEPLACLEPSTAITDVKDLSSEFLTTMACGEEGASTC